jgi:muramoyltetrapeptide carboxypeptidase LdcA involved in peptidoglycan recycling
VPQSPRPSLAELLLEFIQALGTSAAPANQVDITNAIQALAEVKATTSATEALVALIDTMSATPASRREDLQNLALLPPLEAVMDLRPCNDQATGHECPQGLPL